MVFTTLVRQSRNFKGGPSGPDRFWKRRKILRMSAHFYGRKRNCYTVALRSVYKAWQYVTKGRKLRKHNMTLLWNQRITAACEENGISFETLRQGLLRLDILLNRKVLSDLAIWEPRTFKSLSNLAVTTAKEDGLNSIKSLSEPLPSGVYTRHLLKNN